MIWVIPIVLVAALGAALSGPIMSNVKQAKYTVLETKDDIEIREYPSMIAAQVQMPSARKEAINQGFRILFDYISGNNSQAQKVNMTAPVIQQSNEKMAMTAPVTQTIDGKLWIVRFIMPANYTLKTLPKPNNDSINIEEIPKSCYAVIRFSGIGSTQNLKKYTTKLQSYLNEHHLKVMAEPIYAFFNPPWTLPFMRRNEVMIELTAFPVKQN